MVINIDELLHSYKDWLFDNIETRAIADNIEITLPILDRDNDHLQIYLKEIEPDNYLLTDDGYTISNLELTGCSLDTERRQELLLEAIHGFGVILGDDNELQITATGSTFPQKINNILQAILAVDDLAYLAPSNVNTIFVSEIMNWLKEKKVRYSPRVSLRGKNEIYYSFDILIPASPDNKAPERIIESFGNFDLKQAEALAYRWDKVKSLRKNTKIYIIFNNKRISKKVDAICKAENMMSVPFSEIEKIASEITA